jgi:peptidoglycan/LPS O-acetylase OafA/YrhL
MQQPLPVTQTSHRYKPLDSLRGLAALFVFFGHYLGIWGDIFSHKNLVETPLGILFNGTASVMLFFVLSGFVLSLPFINGEKPLKLTAFYVKRILRIYPAFIFAIGLSLLFK